MGLSVFLIFAHLEHTYQAEARVHLFRRNWGEYKFVECVTNLTARTACG